MGLRGQVWVTDFTIAFIVFGISLIIFFVYLGNVVNIGEKEIENIGYDSRLVANQLVKKGVPDSWDEDISQIQKIGLLKLDQLIDADKVRTLTQLPYQRVKEMLSVKSDFFVYFTDELGSVVNVGGVCGYGHPSLLVPVSQSKVGWASTNIGDGENGGLWWTCDLSYAYNPGANFHMYRLQQPSSNSLNAALCPNPLGGAYKAPINGVYPSPVSSNLYPPAMQTADPSINAMNASWLFLHNISNADFDLIILEGSFYNASERENITRWLKKGGTLILFDWWCDERYPGCEDGKSYAGIGAHFNNSIDLNYSLNAEKYLSDHSKMNVNATFASFEKVFNLEFGTIFEWIPDFDSVVNPFLPTGLELAAVNRLSNNSVFYPLAIFVNHPSPDYNILDFPRVIPSSYDPFPFAMWRYYDGTVYYLSLNRTKINSSTENPCVKDKLYDPMPPAVGSPLIPLTIDPVSGLYTGPPGHPINAKQNLIRNFTSPSMISIFTSPPPAGLGLASPYYINCNECASNNLPSPIPPGFVCDPADIDPAPGVQPHPLWDPPEVNNYFVDMLTYLNYDLIKCGNVDLSSLDFENLVPSSRIVQHKQKLLNMVVYAWK